MSQCCGMTIKKVRCMREIMRHPTVVYYCAQHSSQKPKEEPQKPKEEQSKDEPKQPTKDEPKKYTIDKPQVVHPKTYKFTYSNSTQKVSVFLASFLIDNLHISQFVSRYIIPYMRCGIIISNPYNLTQENAEYFTIKNGERRIDKTVVNSQPDDSLLKIQGIKTKTDYKKWIVKNHPDKNNDPTTKEVRTTLFDKIVQIGKVKFS